MNGPGGDASGGRHGPTGGGAARLVNTSTHILMGLPTFMPLDHMTCLCNYRERKQLQEKARRPRAKSPTNNKQSVKSVKTQLSMLKENTAKSDSDSSHDPPDPEPSSKESMSASLPPLPDVVLPPPSLLSGRVGGPLRLRQSLHSLHRYQIWCI